MDLRRGGAVRKAIFFKWKLNIPISTTELRRFPVLDVTPQECRLDAPNFCLETFQLLAEISYEVHLLRSTYAV